MKSLLPSSSTPTRLFRGGEEGGKSKELGEAALAGCVIPTPSWKGPVTQGSIRRFGSDLTPFGPHFPIWNAWGGEDSSQLQSVMLLCSGVEESA